MSRVYFHTSGRTVGIGGRERASFGMLCWRLTEATLEISPDSSFLKERIERFRAMLKPGHYTADERDDRVFAMRLATALHVDSPLVWNGQGVESFSLQLNTALTLGSDAVKLAARIHGQCEIHGWVAGPSRAWLADIIERGLADGVFHHGIGQPPHEWTDVIALLREDDKNECVMSYSVCEQFPSLSAAREVDASLDSYERDPAGRWSTAMAGLRAATGGLELRPDDWDSFRFTHKLSAIDLAADDWRERLNAGLPRAA